MERNDEENIFDKTRTNGNKKWKNEINTWSNAIEREERKKK